MSTAKFDVAIVGAGVVGLSAALELSLAGARVIVFDRQQPGLESSWAAAGMLAPGPDSPGGDALVPLARESSVLYPQFVSLVEDASGLSTSFAQEGTLEVFPAPAGEFARDEFVAHHRRHGLVAAAISPDLAREMEPSLSADNGSVAWLPEEATIDPRRLLEALVSAAKTRGAQIHANCEVSSLLYESRRCAGVIAAGEKTMARSVLITAGCFSGAMKDGIARYFPTCPVRGQMISLRHAHVRLTRVLRSEHGYLVPRSDGRIIAGSTLEHSGFTKAVTPGGVQKILTAALELVPALDDAQILETWSGLRPGTPDDLPILGPTDVEGLHVATGHYRNGILLAPVTAKLVREWITTGKTNLDVAAFSPLRFQRSASCVQKS